jgi:hypothetical protein
MLAHAISALLVFSFGFVCPSPYLMLLSLL